MVVPLGAQARNVDFVETRFVKRILLLFGIHYGLPSNNRFRLQSNVVKANVYKKEAYTMSPNRILVTWIHFQKQTTIKHTSEEENKT
jgi:hypothetical protein